MLSTLSCREMKHIRKLSSLTAYTYFMNLVTVGGSTHIAHVNTPDAINVSRSITHILCKANASVSDRSRWLRGHVVAFTARCVMRTHCRLHPALPPNRYLTLSLRAPPLLPHPPAPAAAAPARAAPSHHVPRLRHPAVRAQPYCRGGGRRRRRHGGVHARGQGGVPGAQEERQGGGGGGGGAGRDNPWVCAGVRSGGGGSGYGTRRRFVQRKRQRSW